MKTGRYLHFTLAVAMLVLGISSARASTVVYDDFDVVSEDTVFTTPFVVTRTGTYKAELVDFEYPLAFDILSLGITQNAVPLGFGFDMSRHPGPCWPIWRRFPWQGVRGPMHFRSRPYQFPPLSHCFSPA